MAPFGNSEIVPLSEVPEEEFSANPIKYEEQNVKEPVVLVVDDEPLVVDTLGAILSQAGYRVIKAYGGPKALELSRSTRPALLISDVAMPQMNGVELALAVTQHTPDCDVILFSGHATERDLEPARKAGHYFTLLSKPVHPVDMLRHVARSLQNSLRKKIQTHCIPQPTLNSLVESA